MAISVAVKLPATWTRGRVELIEGIRIIYSAKFPG